MALASFCNKTVLATCLVSHTAIYNLIYEKYFALTRCIKSSMDNYFSCILSLHISLLITLRCAVNKFIDYRFATFSYEQFHEHFLVQKDCFCSPLPQIKYINTFKFFINTTYSNQLKNCSLCFQVYLVILASATHS